MCVRRNAQSTVDHTLSFVIPADVGVGFETIPDGIDAARIEFARPFKICHRSIPARLPSIDHTESSRDFRTIRHCLMCFRQLGAGSLVIAMGIVMIKPEGEMRFAESRLNLERAFRRFLCLLNSR